MKQALGLVASNCRCRDVFALFYLETQLMFAHRGSTCIDKLCLLNFLFATSYILVFGYCFSLFLGDIEIPIA